MNLQEVAGGKKFLELLLGVKNFTGYRLIRRTMQQNMKEDLVLNEIQKKIWKLVNIWQSYEGLCGQKNSPIALLQRDIQIST